MCKKVICMSDLTNWFSYKVWQKVFIKKKKVGPPRKMTCLSGLRFFNCYGSNSEEGFSKLESSLSISNLCLSYAASHYDDFNLRKHKITSFETLSTKTMS